MTDAEISGAGPEGQPPLASADSDERLAQLEAKLADATAEAGKLRDE